MMTGKQMARRIIAANGGSVEGLKMLLGLLSAETDDMESPAITIASELARKGADIAAFDPAAMDEAPALPAATQYCDTVETYRG